MARSGFLGDNDQGHVFAAQARFEDGDGRGERTQVVLLHATQDPGKAITECQQSNDDAFTLDLPEGERVHYFHVYSKASLWAWEKGLGSA